MQRFQNFYIQRLFSILYVKSSCHTSAFVTVLIQLFENREKDANRGGYIKHLQLQSGQVDIKVNQDSQHKGEKGGTDITVWQV